MRRHRFGVLLVLLVLLGLTSYSTAQYIPPTGPNMAGRPQLSPYLNMLRGGNSAANYYMGVVPEKINRENFNNIESNLIGLDARVNQVGKAGPSYDPLYYSTPLPPTGHRTWYGTPNSTFGQAPSAIAGTQLRSTGQTPRQPGGTQRPNR